MTIYECNNNEIVLNNVYKLKPTEKAIAKESIPNNNMSTSSRSFSTGIGRRILVWSYCPVVVPYPSPY